MAQKNLVIQAFDNQPLIQINTFKPQWQSRSLSLILGAVWVQIAWTQCPMWTQYIGMDIFE
jgi:hypothetical protein